LLPSAEFKAGNRVEPQHSPDWCCAGLDSLEILDVL
jgi:hypothetical protein